MMIVNLSKLLVTLKLDLLEQATKTKSLIKKAVLIKLYVWLK